MLPMPTKFTLAVGCAEGTTALNAFDNALLAAGLGNLNLVRVSSILPPGAQFVENLHIPPGSLTPTAYGYQTSDQPGQVVAAAVAIAFSKDPASFGVIMETEGLCSREEAEERVRQMAVDAMAQRGMELGKVWVKGVEHRVERVGCAFAAVALWY